MRRRTTTHLWLVTIRPHGTAVGTSTKAENLLQVASHAIAAAVACHSAVRVGDRLTAPEMQAIIEQLADTPEPHHCPTAVPR